MNNIMCQTKPRTKQFQGELLDRWCKSFKEDDQ